MAREKTVTLWEARYGQYEVNYSLRQEFKAMPPNVQEKYHMLAYSLPEWRLNLWGCPDSNYELERQMCLIAIENKLDCAWFLISFYTSEAGWEEYVRQFNELPPDESYPAQGFPISIAMRTPADIDKEVIHIPPVDN